MIPPRAALLVLAAALALVPPARAVVPSPVKLLRALADSHRDAGRTTGVRAQVMLTREDAPAGSGPVASGELLSDPEGRARLELRLADGRIERHLLRAGSYRLARAGVPAQPEPPLLPPVTLLQNGSSKALYAAAASMGVDMDRAELGQTHGRDCYVVGGRDLPAAGAGRPTPRASLWIEVESYEVCRIERADGVVFRLGPTHAFGELRFPQWLGVEAPGAAPLRLWVRDAVAARIPESAFSDAWLAGP